MTAYSINTVVTFRLTHAGLDVWFEHCRQLGLDPSQYVSMGINEDGSYTWPLWEVMSVFGPHIYMAMPRMFFEGNELRFPITAPI
jgi:hypothetical protein